MQASSGLRGLSGCRGSLASQIRYPARQARRRSAGRALQAVAAVSGVDAPTSTGVQFPLELPLFPVQPVGVFIPGMTKTLHLYEDHFVALVEEAMRSPHRLMATAVLEPFTGQEQGPGSFVGGHNFALSCACLAKVLDAKPYPGGYLVRIRGEARLGITGLSQVEPYMRATCVNMPDPAPPASQVDALAAQVAALDDVMRSVQMLASKFRCDETASIQQAFRFVNERPLVPNILEASEEEQAAAHSHTGSDGSTGHAAGSSQPEAAAASSSSNGSTQPAASSRPETLRGAAFDMAGLEGEEEPLDLQRAARLSYASLQWLPQSNVEERFAVLRGRLMAMEAGSLEERLMVTTAIMDAARGGLAAKCAIMSMQ